MKTVVVLFGLAGLFSSAVEGNMPGSELKGSDPFNPQSLTEGEELMFTMDVPYVPVQDTPIVLAQTVAPGAVTHPDYLLNICTEKPSAGGLITAMNMVDPATWLAVQLENRGKQFANFDAATSSIKLTQFVATTHGELIPQETDSERIFYIYQSELGYVGKDRAVFIAEFEGKRYKIVIDLIVSMVIDEDSPQCPPPTHQSQRQPRVQFIGLRSRY